MKVIQSMRLDKWLWSARFFKTRAISQKHIELGRVKVNGYKVKNSKMVQVGDIIDMQLNGLPYRLSIVQLNRERRPAYEAKLMYEEDIETVKKRAELSLLNQVSRIIYSSPEKGRPTKKDRRLMDKVRK